MVAISYLKYWGAGETVGVFALDLDSDELYFCISSGPFPFLDSGDAVVLQSMPQMLKELLSERGGRALLKCLQEDLSNALRLTEQQIREVGDPRIATIELLAEAKQQECGPNT